MADFCKQCSEELFGRDFGDMKGLVSEEEVKKGYGAGVLCEGCGFTRVNHEGECLGGCDNSAHP